MKKLLFSLALLLCVGSSFGQTAEELIAKYKELADKEQNVIFGGRLAEYKYYDMAPIVEKVLKMEV